MKAKDVKIGSIYTIDINGKITPVEIVSVCSCGGWNGFDLLLNKRVHISTTARFHCEVKEE